MRFALFLSLTLLLIEAPAYAGRCDDPLRPHLGSPYLPAAEQPESGLSLAETLRADGTVVQPRRPDAGERVILFKNGTAAVGKLAKVFVDSQGHPAYLGFDSASQLMLTSGQGSAAVLPGQGYEQHAHGFGMPVGTPLEVQGQDISVFKVSDWKRFGIEEGAIAQLSYVSGVKVSGVVQKLQVDAEGIVRVIKLVDATVTLRSQTLFMAEWGDYDFLLGTQIANSALKP